MPVTSVSNQRSSSQPISSQKSERRLPAPTSPLLGTSSRKINATQNVNGDVRIGAIAGNAAITRKQIEAAVDKDQMLAMTAGCFLWIAVGLLGLVAAGILLTTPVGLVIGVAAIALLLAIATTYSIKKTNDLREKAGQERQTGFDLLIAFGLALVAPPAIALRLACGS